MYEEEVICALCGNKQTVTELGSTNSFGPMDLDTRPAEMQRSTLHLWVHECTECGFVAPELKESVASDGRVATSRSYLEELGMPGRNRTVNRFVCRSILDEAAGDFGAAGWRRLHAACACDDAALQEEARVQRLKALALFEKARAAGGHAMKSVLGGDEILLADLARRAGEFDQAFQFCTAGLVLAHLPEFVGKLLRFERALVMARDTACHNVGEADLPESPRGTVH
jgi:hypothetical protein